MVDLNHWIKEKRNHGPVTPALQLTCRALKEAPSFFNNSTRLLSPKYRPFGAEHTYANLTRGSTTATTYEYYHLQSATDSSVPDSWNKLYAELASNTRSDMAEIGVPFGELTLRILHYPPQINFTHKGSHIDFCYLTYLMGELIIDEKGDRKFTLMDKLMIGEMASIAGHGTGTVHRGAVGRFDRYVIVGFVVPPLDYQIGNMTVEDYLDRVLDYSRIK